MREIVDIVGASTASEPGSDAGAVDPGRWSVVNDDVMGGRSSSRVERTGEGSVRFRGQVSLENNGGFASIRTDLGTLDLSDARGVALRVRGDDRRYQIRLRTTGPWSRIWYRADFETVAGEWLEIRSPFSEFEPTFRGRRPPDAPPLDPSAIRQLGFLIADKREGPFELEVSWIRAYGGEG